MMKSITPFTLSAFAFAVFASAAVSSEQAAPPSRATDKTAITAKTSASPVPANAPAEIALDQLFVFEDATTCALGETGYRTISSLIALPGDGRILPGKLQTPPAFRIAFGKPTFERVASDYHRAAVPIFATWNGLRLIRLESGFIGNDGSHFDFVFEEPFEKVRSTLNRLGFTFDTEGSQGDPPLEGFESKLSAKGSTTILSCSR